MNREVDLRAALGVVRAEKRMRRTQNAVPTGQTMKHHGMQLWRPKVTAQCVSSDAGTLEPNVVTSTGSLDQLTAVFEDVTSNKPENKFSASVEVNQAVIQSIKAKRNKMKRKIEAESNTSLTFSKQKSGFYIVVEGLSDEAVQQATRLLQPVIDKKDTKAESVTEKSASSRSSSLNPASTKRLASGSLQWMPKAVRTMHTVADECKDVSDVEQNDSEMVSGSIQVDKKLLRLVKGHKNEVKQRIEKDTNTTIRFGNPVVVEGSSEDSVNKALEEIQRIVEEGVNDAKFQYSHFLSLPLSVHPSLVQKLEAFQESVLVSLGIPLVDEEQTAAADAEETPEQEAPEEEAAAAAAETVTSGVEEHVDDTRSVEAPVEDAFRQSVLGSLGIQPNEGDETDAATQGTVLSEIQVEEEPAATETVGEEETESGSQLHVEGETLATETEETVAEEVTETDNTAASETLETVAADEDTEREQQNAVAEVRVEMETTADLPEEKAEGTEPLQDVPLTLKKKKDSGVEKSIFIKPTRFHLTVLMLKLWNEERVEKARGVLEKCLPDVAATLDKRPVSVSLKGLEIMRGSPKNTRVLFAKVADADGGSRLSKACQVMIDAFVEAGLVLGKDGEQELKLHATVMNTSHRRRYCQSCSFSFLFVIVGVDSVLLAAKVDTGTRDSMPRISSRSLEKRPGATTKSWRHTSRSVSSMMRMVTTTAVALYPSLEALLRRAYRKEQANTILSEAEQKKNANFFLPGRLIVCDCFAP
ncbi:uncharacterized protein LOC9662125 isoform X2 [Selaginella moellendorffii]|nr:uncharacterized protein LOC9662125 isoform X2 [Selaginella moellendorffii]|eukprot:XP_024521847.1 uncharacterized protein LOC9662125 isoform X2 [Selaginella moellendorffii]